MILRRALDDSGMRDFSCKSGVTTLTSRGAKKKDLSRARDRTKRRELGQKTKAVVRINYGVVEGVSPPLSLPFSKRKGKKKRKVSPPLDLLPPSL